MKDTAKELHEKCKKLNSDQLIEVLYLMNKNGDVDPRAFQIMKMYLYIALQREGVLWKNITNLVHLQMAAIAESVKCMKKILKN